jgi:hypothetical protein
MANYVVSIQELRDTAVCTHMKESELHTEFLQFFKRQPSAPWIDDWRIPGFKIPLRPHQIFASWWMLVKSCSIQCGGFLADEPGIGKV